MFHCEECTGYAIASLENAFFLAAIKAGYSDANIYWSYSKMVTNRDIVFEISYNVDDCRKKLIPLIKEKNIKTILAFDLPQPSIISKIAKKMGVRVVSYWGASMSSLNSGPKLWLKRLECLLRSKSMPNIFIFESDAMRQTATHGRGISFKKTTVIPLGVDTEMFFPSLNKSYIKNIFNIQNNRRVLLYSGHMEERKGVGVIIKAAKNLAETGRLSGLHFVICGNKDGEERPFVDLLKNSAAKQHVTFAGYRTDMPELMRSSDLGIIASTGWDSFTMSSIEMLASGLPLIVSNLQGLSETIIPGESGEYIIPGNHTELGEKIFDLLNHPKLYKRYAVAARKRAEDLFSIKLQVKKISEVITKNI